MIIVLQYQEILILYMRSKNWQYQDHKYQNQVEGKLRGARDEKEKKKRVKIAIKA